MKKCDIKRIVNKLLFPHIVIFILCVFVSFGLLVYTFINNDEYSIVAYISYAMSFYALILVCARLSRIKISEFKNKIHSNKYMHLYLTDINFHTHISLIISLVINTGFAIMKLVFGIYYQSIWFITLAVYYIALTLMRCMLLWHINKNDIGTNLYKELKQYRNCGIVLLILNAAFSGEVILTIAQDVTIFYPGYLIYVVAMYAFYSIISAIYDAIKYRKYHSPIVLTVKNIKLVTALVSMLSLETAMISHFDVDNSLIFKQTMTSITGGVVCIIVLLLSLNMLINANKKLKIK